MKTTCRSQNNSKKNKIALSKINVLFSLFLNLTFLSAQESMADFRVGLSAGAYISGNAHGTVYDFSATL